MTVDPHAARNGRAQTDAARDLERLARTDPAALSRRMAELSVRQQAELALRLPPAARLELLLHAPRPMRLVRSLPDAEFHATVRELGPSDALPLLALGSAEQLMHLLDLESWRRDRFDGQRAGAWAALLAEAGDPVLRRWLRHADEEGLALLLQRWARPEAIEDDAEPFRGQPRAETSDERGTVAPDGEHRIRPRIAAHVPALIRMLRLLLQDDPVRYRRLLREALLELPSSLEESALHWRQSRLDEHGYPPLEEALAVYAPAARGAPPPAVPVPADPEGVPAPRSPVRQVGGLPGELAAQLDRLPAALHDRAMFELVAVANRVLVADGGDTGDPAAHRAALRKALACVALGAGRMAGGDGRPQADRLRELLGSTPMLELFRTGHDRIAEVRREAEGLLARGWPGGRREALELMEPPVGDRVAALLEHHPRYLELRPDGRGVLREFESPAEIEETRAAVEMTALAGRVLVEHLGLDVERVLAWSARPAAGAPVRLGTFLLTLLAWHAVRGEWRGDPLPPEVVAAFLRQVASRRTAPPEAAAGALEALLEELGGRLELGRREVALLRAFGRAALERLTAECGELDPDSPVDPRFVTCLLVA